MAIDHYDWYGEDVAIPQQQAIAIYKDQCGEIVQIVICQRDHYDEERAKIFVAIGNVPALTKALQAIADVEADTVNKDSALPQPTKPVPLSSAERQRRHRDKQRKGVGQLTHLADERMSPSAEISSEH